MSLQFLPEDTKAALFALDLAQREAVQLQFTHKRLFIKTPTLEWVKNLSNNLEEAERLDAFVGRFSRLQDHLGEKLLPRFATLIGAAPRSMLDALNTAERMNWIGNAQQFFVARKLRNLMVHEYMIDPNLFLDSILAADETCTLLYDTVMRVQAWADSIQLKSNR